MQCVVAVAEVEVVAVLVLLAAWLPGCLANDGDDHDQDDDNDDDNDNDDENDDANDNDDDDNDDDNDDYV